MDTATPLIGKANMWDHRALSSYEERLRHILSKQEIKAKGKTSTQANKARGK